MDITVRSLSLGEQWLHQMAEASHKTGLTLQYCMAPPRHTLTSLYLPVATQVFMYPNTFTDRCIIIKKGNTAHSEIDSITQNWMWL